MDFATSISVPKKSKNHNGKIPWTKASSVKQCFSLPSTIIYYITKYPSTPEVYLKMVKSCKYFFEKHSLLIVSRIYCEEKKISCSSTDGKCIKENSKRWVDIDIEKNKSKIWLISYFCIRSQIPRFLPLLFSKLYKLHNARLNLYRTELSLRDLESIASKFQKFYFLGAEITNSDGDAAMLENILGSIPNVKEFDIYFERNNPMVTALTMKNILNLKNLGNLQHLFLENIPEVLNVEDLGNFIKNYHKNAKLRFNFEWNISNEYKNQLHALVDTVIASEYLHCFICYRGQDFEKYEIMYNRYHGL